MKVYDLLINALLLELSTTPKPGCVDREFDHDDTTFNDFLKSSVAVGRAFESNLNKSLGEIIYESAKMMRKSHGGKNTHFGAILLNAPLFKSVVKLESDFFEISDIKKTASKMIENSTVEDAVFFYKAINLIEVGSLKEYDEYDVTSDETMMDLYQENITFYDLMKVSEEFDDIANELINGFPRTLGAYSKLKDTNIENKDMIRTFMHLLTKPDTHVVKVHSRETAEEVSKMAQNLVKNWDTVKLQRMNDKLNKSGISPGTTADILSASIFLSLIYQNIM